MEFFNKNKQLIIQIVVGAILASLLYLLHLPIWLIGALVAVFTALATEQVVKLFDDHLEPQIQKIGKKEK